MSPPRIRILAVVALLLTTAVACGDSGGLKGAGATPTATGPARLWPDLAPASSPAWDYDDGESELMHGISVPGDDIRKVDPVTVVRTEIFQHPDRYSGAKAEYRETARRMADCGGKPAGARCPLLKAYYRDLTGDGHDDLTLGFRLLPGNQTAVRVYTVQAGRLVQVMANDDAVLGVELAGRSVIIRSPSDLADYEYRVQWTWDPEQLTMLLTHDEMIQTGGRHAKRRPASPAPTPTASTSAR